MGLFDWLFAGATQQGQQAVAPIVQPTSSPVSSGGGGQPSSGGSQPSQQGSPINLGSAIGNLGGAIGNIGTTIYTTVYGQSPTIVSQRLSTPVQSPIVVSPIQSTSPTNPIQSPSTIPSTVSTIYTTVFGRSPVEVSQQMVTPISRAPTSIPSNISNVTPVMMAPRTTGTLFVMQGDKGQIAVDNVKVLYTESGSFEAISVPYGHYITNIDSSGGAGALQSGGFSTKPLTPVVYTRESAGTVLDPRFANAPAATMVLANPDAYSDVGAEAYGGTVQPLDSRTIQSTGVSIGRYPAETGNLSNLVSPTILNQKKETWAQDIPVVSYAEFGSMATINSVAMPGTIGTSISPISFDKMTSIGMAPVPFTDRLVGGNIVAGTFSTVETPKRPFVSVNAGPVEMVGSNNPIMQFFLGPERPASSKMQSPFGGLLGYQMWGEKKDEVLTGAVGSGADFVTGMVGLTPFKDAMTTTDPRLSAWRVENTQMKATATPEEYNKFLQKSFEQGLLVKPITSATFVENPQLTYGYGEFTKWGTGVGNSFKNALGITQAQEEAYQYNIEQRKGLGTIPEKLVFGTGYTLTTSPEKVISATIGGAMMFVGGEVVGGLAAGTSIGARVGAYALAHPTVAMGAKAVVPAVLLGMTYYGASEGFTASPERTTVNIGKMAPELVGVTLGIGGAFALTRSGMGTESFAGLDVTGRMRVKDINTEFQDMDFGPEGNRDVRNIVTAIKGGEKMPPILVSERGYLQDGRHRLAAYKQLGIEEIDVVYGDHPAATVVPKLSSEPAVEGWTVIEGTIPEPLVVKKSFEGPFGHQDMIAEINKPVVAADIFGTKQNTISKATEPFLNQNREMGIYFDKEMQPMASVYGEAGSIENRPRYEVEGHARNMGVATEDLTFIHQHPKNRSSYPSTNDIGSAAVDGIWHGVSSDTNVRMYTLRKAKNIETSEGPLAYELADWWGEIRKPGRMFQTAETAWEGLKTSRGVETVEFTRGNQLVNYAGFDITGRGKKLGKSTEVALPVETIFLPGWEKTARVVDISAPKGKAPITPEFMRPLGSTTESTGAGAAFERPAIDFTGARIVEDIATKAPESWRDIRTSTQMIPEGKPIVGEAVYTVPKSDVASIEPANFFHDTTIRFKGAEIPMEIKGSTGQRSIMTVSEISKPVEIIDLTSALTEGRGTTAMGTKASSPIKTSPNILQTRTDTNLYWSERNPMKLRKGYDIHNTAIKGSVPSGKSAGNWLKANPSSDEMMGYLRIALMERKTPIEFLGKAPEISIHTQPDITIGRERFEPVSLGRTGFEPMSEHVGVADINIGKPDEMVGFPPIERVGRIPVSLAGNAEVLGFPPVEKPGRASLPILGIGEKGVQLQNPGVVNENINPNKFAPTLTQQLRQIPERPMVPVPVTKPQPIPERPYVVRPTEPVQPVPERPMVPKITTPDEPVPQRPIVPPSDRPWIEVPPIVVPPVILPGGIGPGGGGSSTGFRGAKSWTSLNPVGAALMGAKRKMNFKPMKAMKFKK
jgi:hypothetical protein